MSGTLRLGSSDGYATATQPMPSFVGKPANKSGLFARLTGTSYRLAVARSGSMEVLYQQNFGGRLVVLRIEQKPAVLGKAKPCRRCARDAAECLGLAARVAYESDESTSLVSARSQEVNALGRDTERRRD